MLRLTSLTILFIQLAFFALDHIYCQEYFNSSGFVCVGSQVDIQCPENHVIIVNHIQHRHTVSQCTEFNFYQGGKGEKSLHECVGIIKYDKEISTACDGHQFCNLKMSSRSNKIGHYGTNCDFESNIANIFYSCVPDKLGKPYKAFDICDPNGPETILGIEKGFIHSPNYPDYYGNSLGCYVNIGVPKGYRLILYLLTSSLEGKSIFGKLNDYLVIDNYYEIYGESRRPHIVYDDSDRSKIQLKFFSDWMTSRTLTFPKGFLLFFQLIPIEPSTTTSSPSTLISTTILSTTSTARPISKQTDLPTSESQTYSRYTTRFENLFQDETHNRIDSQKTDDQMINILVTLLVTVSFFLIIVTLFLLFKKKTNNTSSDYIYENSDGKSMSSSSNYNDEYQNTSIISSIIIKKDNEHENKKTNEFNAKLKKFYSDFTGAIRMSTSLLKNKAPDQLNQKENNMKEQAIKTYNLNEFNPNDVDIKYEKEIAIDKLKLVKSNNTNVSSTSLTTNVMKCNSARLLSNRFENNYVINPTFFDSCKIDLNDDYAKESGKLQIYEVNFDKDFAYITPSLNTSVDLNLSTTTTSALLPTSISAQVETSVKNKSKENIEETEIYQTISGESSDDDDVEGNMHEQKNKSLKLDHTIDLNDTKDQLLNETIDSNKPILNQPPIGSNSFHNAAISYSNVNTEQVYTAASTIYATPTNKRVSNLTQTYNESPTVLQNSSIVKLLNDEYNDSQA